MKTAACLFVTLLVGIAQLHAADLTNKFIRQPGTYSLDGKGSRVSITQPQPGTSAISISWTTAPGETSAAETPDILKAKGWFVYVENPNRIWVFDGLDQGALYTNQPKHTEVKSLYFNQKNIPALPQAFRDALPQKLRARSSEKQAP